MKKNAILSISIKKIFDSKLCHEKNFSVFSTIKLVA